MTSSMLDHHLILYHPTKTLRLFPNQRLSLISKVDDWIYKQRHTASDLIFGMLDSFCSEEDIVEALPTVGGVLGMSVKPVRTGLSSSNEVGVVVMNSGETTAWLSW